MNVMKRVNAQWMFDLVHKNIYFTLCISVNVYDGSVELLYFNEYTDDYPRWLPWFNSETQKYHEEVKTLSEYLKLMTAEKMAITNYWGCLKTCLFLNDDFPTPFNQADSEEDSISVNIGGEEFNSLDDRLYIMPAEEVEMFKKALAVSREYALKHFPKENE
ncbi:hypothetical protein [Candidatus Liberibacter sp.]|uniref:hypothetical protein n=1 Tax=Candidatus Liberibacter sp. TaxID=34022 RepID=UPI0015F35DFD|nr:hypothetical protein [Candidatus Liberibacter sp.]MBA5724604.1 hypothetical protein [Candidatus Liberibacter sp.]